MLLAMSRRSRIGGACATAKLLGMSGRLLDSPWPSASTISADYSRIRPRRDGPILMVFCLNQQEA